MKNIYLVGFFWLLVLGKVEAQEPFSFPYQDKDLKGTLKITIQPNPLVYSPSTQPETESIKITCEVLKEDGTSVNISFDKIEASNIPVKYIKNFDASLLVFHFLPQSNPIENEVNETITLKLRFKKNKAQPEVVIELPCKILANAKKEEISQDSTENSTKLEIINKSVYFEGEKGFITLEIQGGTPPYRVDFAKKPNTTSQRETGNSAIVLKNLEQGTYKIAISDQQENDIPVFEIEVKNDKNKDENIEIDPEHTTVQKSKEEKLWEKINAAGNNPEVQYQLVKQYIREYPQGIFIGLAKTLAKDLSEFLKNKKQKNTDESIDSLEILAYNVIPSRKGKNNGQISVEIQGGKPPYTYALMQTGKNKSKKITSEKTQHQFVRLPAGEYLLTITDESGQRQTSTKKVKEVGSEYQDITLTITNSKNIILVTAKGGKGEITINYRNFHSENTYSTKTSSGKTVEIPGFQYGNRVEIRATDGFSEAIEIYKLPEADSWQLYAILIGITVAVAGILWYFRKIFYHLFRRVELSQEKPQTILPPDNQESRIKIRIRKPKDEL